MVTSSVWMLHRVLSNTTNLGPAVALDGVFVVGASSLEQGLIGTASSGNDTNLGTNGGGDGLLSARGKTQTSGSLVFVVGDNNSKGSRASSKGTAVSTLGFDVADNGSFGDLVQRHDITDGKSGLLSTVDELSGVHSFGAKEKFIVSLIPVGIEKLHLGDGSTSTRVVDDFLHDATNVTLLFGVIEGTKLDSTLAGTDMCLEDRGLSLTLGLSIQKRRTQNNNNNTRLR